MAPSSAGDETTPEVIASPSSSSSSSSSSSALDVWKNRIIIPTLVAGIGGGGVGLISKHRKVHGVAKMSATYAANFAIVTGCYCGAREFVRVSRTGKPDDLFNSLIGGFGSGAILGRLQGGPVAAARYSVIFAVVGTTVDYAALKTKPLLRNFYNSLVGDSDKSQQWLKLPEWSPIQVLDEEALAAKRAREEQIYRSVRNLKKEET
ncbi:uncharacterized protein [Coffea arabica]|uniref:Mitochondrial import inner membrane translocase subunit TIM17-2-like n=1 Tax=Coffea arabica TaxID=13443 RepID=A0A6P6WIT3_COFAR|nr:uncharacterized protein LOC113732719 [Coffea arabica]